MSKDWVAIDVDSSNDFDRRVPSAMSKHAVQLAQVWRGDGDLCWCSDGAWLYADGG